jgi:hypothetical protein
MTHEFADTDAVKAADRVVAAIRARDWQRLQSLLTASHDAAGSVAPWQEATELPQILDGPEVQTIPPFLLRYPGKTLVRYPMKARLDGQKLEVIVERRGAEFFAIDFWGFGWP